MIKDSRIRSLVMLAVLVILVFVQMMPAKDKYASLTMSGDVSTKDYLKCILYLFIALPADAIFTDTVSEYALMPYYNFETSALLTGLMIGAVVIFSIIIFGRRKGTLAYILVPHLLFAGFSAVIYFGVHHMGIWFFHFIFWLIITNDSDKKVEFKFYEKVIPVYKSVSACVLLIAVAIALYLSTASCIAEINSPYSNSKEIAEYLEENNFKQYKVMMTWYAEYDETDPDNPVLEMVYPDLNSSDEINAYLGYNIFYNIYDGSDKAYIHHRKFPLEESRELADKWKEQGYPDILVGFPDMEYVFGEKDIIKNYYSPIFCANNDQIWKGYVTNSFSTYIYMRNDLVEELGLKTISTAFGR